MNNYMKTIISGLKHWVSSQKSDWNQNDPKATNYVKNRTHYVYEDEVEVLPLTKLTDSVSDLGEFTGYILSNLLIKLDTKYKIKFDEEIYTCFGYTDSLQPDAIFLGNGALLESLGLSFGENTGEPFFLVQVGEEAVVATDKTNPHTIFISEITETVKKLDKKYLPELPPETLSDWNQNDSTAADYIKNRTHYSYTNKIEILPLTTITITEADGMYIADIENLSLEANKKYEIVFGTKTYYCTGQTIIAPTGVVTVLLGNISLVGMGEDTGEPFVIIYIKEYE